MRAGCRAFQPVRTNRPVSMRPRDICLAVAAAFIWGATFPVSAIALQSTPPIFFAFLRFLCAAAFILVIPRPAVPWRMLICAGLLFGIGQYGLMFVSITQGIPAGLASLLIHTQAFFTIIIAVFVFSERLGSRQILALAVAAVGLACLVADRSGAGALTGLVLILIAALCGAFGNIVLKSLGGADMLGVAVWMSMAAPLPLLALSLVFEAGGSAGDLIASISWVTIAAAVYSAVLATVLVYAIWGRLLADYAAASVAPFFLLVPVFGISLSALILGERLSDLEILGAALVFFGLAMAVWPKRSST